MKRTKFNKISILVFVFGMTALVLGGSTILQNGLDSTFLAQAAGEDPKVDWDWWYLDDYANWPSASTPIDPDPTRYWLYGNNINAGTTSSYVDVNGDGLVDFIYSYNNGSLSRLVLLINNGANEFVPEYLCYYYNSMWYGNCVDPDWTWGS